MGEKLIGLENLPDNFRVLRAENDFIYLKLYKGRYTIKIKFPFESNEKLASLFGHVLGDGCIKAKEENFYYTNKNKDLVDEVRHLIKELFGIQERWNYNRERNFYETYSPKIIAKFLVLCGFPKGEKVKQEIKIPNWIKNGSFEIKSKFVRALFDDEGSVINSKGNYIIGFSMNKKNFLLNEHKKFMNDFREILISLGLYPNEVFKRKQPFDSVSIGFNLYGRYNLMEFLKNVGFTDKTKRKKLVDAINSYKGYGKNEAKIRILKALENNGCLKTKELSSIINRDRKVVWKILNKLKKKNIVEKVLLSRKGVIEKVVWKLKSK